MTHTSSPLSSPSHPFPLCYLCMRKPWQKRYTQPLSLFPFFPDNVMIFLLKRIWARCRKPLFESRLMTASPPPRRDTKTSPHG